MDLYEYQAKELFAAHGVPVLPGEVADTAEEARAAAAGIGTAVVVKAQVKTGGRGKAGGVKLASDADEAAREGDRDPRHGHQGPHGPPGAGRPRRATSTTEYYVSYLLDRANRTYLAMASVEGGMEIEQLAVERPEALARVPVDPIDGVDAAKAAEIADAAGFPADVRHQVIEVLVKLWDVFTAEDATLVEVNPLVKTAERPGRRAGRQGDPRRQRGLPARRSTAARFEDVGGDRPAGAEGQGEGPQLRQARRRGRHHRQRRRPGHVAPSTWSRTRGSGYGGVPPGQLPRHRRRRLGRGDGQRAGDHPRRPGRTVGVRQRLRRHHRLRRGRERHRAGVRAARPPRRGGHAAAGRPAGRQQRRGGPADPHRGRAARAGAGGHDGRRRASASPSCRREHD